MIDKEKPQIDPVTAEKLRAAMFKELESHSDFKPAPRIRRPALGWMNWEKHKRKLEHRRKAANRTARRTRRTQRAASRA